MQDIKSNAKWVIIALLLIFSGTLGLCSYRSYEPINATGIQTVEATIVSHSGGRSGKAGAQPYFRIKLPNGVITTVQDWGELPYTYTGPVVLNKGKGAVTNVPKYTINRAKTLALHNK
jgi:hypothetical protein